MTRPLLIPIALACVSLISCGKPKPPAPPPVVYPAVPLLAFDFTIKDRTPERQVEMLQSQGFSGIAISFPEPERIEDFNSVPAIRDGSFQLVATVWTLFLDRPLDEKYLANALPAIAKSHGFLWVICGPAAWPVDKAPPPGTIEKIRQLADIAKAQNVDVVLYPHERTPLPNADRALEWKRKIGRSNVKITLNLCHEIKAGNRDHLPEVIKRVLPDVAAVTVNGADVEPDKADHWERTIQSLDHGTMDVHEKFVKPLLAAGYKGPIILHTFGLLDPPREHLARSMKTWQAWVGTRP